MNGPSQLSLRQQVQTLRVFYPPGDERERAAKKPEVAPRREEASTVVPAVFHSLGIGSAWNVLAKANDEFEKISVMAL